MIEGGNTYYYHHDRFGSVTALTSSSGGTEWTYSYEPFGAARQTSKPDPNAPTNPLQYVGQYLDPATGLYDLRARQYDPTTGQFTGTDPTPAGPATPYQTPYDYAGQNPINSYDLSGLAALGSIGEAEELDAPLGLQEQTDAQIAEEDQVAAEEARPTPTDRIKQHLTMSDLRAAQAELKGETVASRADGTAFDHVQEVRDAQRGLLNRMDRINRLLGTKDLPAREGSALRKEFGEASRLLDFSERFVPR